MNTIEIAKRELESIKKIPEEASPYVSIHVKDLRAICEAVAGDCSDAFFREDDSYIVKEREP